MTDHTVKAFTEQLESLSALVAQMGGLRGPVRFGH